MVFIACNGSLVSSNVDVREIILLFRWSFLDRVDSLLSTPSQGNRNPFKSVLLYSSCGSMYDAEDVQVNELYETIRKKVEVAKWILKVIKPLEDLITSMLNSYGILPQAFTSLYQQLQTMQLFHDELKLEELTANMKKPKAKWRQHIYQLSWGKLPPLSPNTSINVFEHHLQVIVTAKKWIEIQQVVGKVVFLLDSFLNMDSTESPSLIVPSGGLDETIEIIHQEIHHHVKVMMETFHRYVTKAFSNDMPLALLEKIHVNVTLMTKFLQSLGDLTFLLQAAASPLIILKSIEMDLRRKFSRLESFLEMPERYDVNLFLSLLELSRQVGQIMKDIESFHDKMNTVFNDLAALGKLLTALQRTTETHPLHDMVMQLTSLDTPTELDYLEENKIPSGENDDE